MDVISAMDKQEAYDDPDTRMRTERGSDGSNEKLEELIVVFNFSLPVWVGLLVSPLSHPIRESELESAHLTSGSPFPFCFQGKTYTMSKPFSISSPVSKISSKCPPAFPPPPMSDPPHT